MSLPVPPRYVNIPSAVKYSRDPRASATIKQTYDELRGLAWVNHYESTPALDLGELLSFLGVGRSAFYDHIKIMSELGWLRSESIGNGKLKIYFSPTIRTLLPDITVESDIPDSDLNINTEDEEDIQHLKNILETSSPSVVNTESQSTNPDLLAALKDMGIEPPKLDPLAADPEISVDYARAVVAWTTDEGNALGLAIYRMEHHHRLPAFYQNFAICEDCGKPGYAHSDYCQEKLYDPIYMAEVNRRQAAYAKKQARY